MNLEKTVKSFLSDIAVSNYEILEDGSVDVYGNINILSTFLRQIPFQFNNVHGDFNCTDNVLLKSFRNFPRMITGDLNCYRNKINTFRHSPQIIHGNFNCNHNNIRTFKRFPEYVGGSISCSFNQMQSFQFAPIKTNGDFIVNDCKIKSLEYCPQEINGHFNCNNNNFTSLYNLPNKKNIKGNMYYSNQDSLSIFFTLYYNRLTLDQKVIYDKYQSYYDIWNPDFDSNEFLFLIGEIKDGLL